MKVWRVGPDGEAALVEEKSKAFSDEALGDIIGVGLERLERERGPGSAVKLVEHLREKVAAKALRPKDEVKAEHKAFIAKLQADIDEKLGIKALAERTKEWNEVRTFRWLGRRAMEKDLVEKVRSIGKKWWSGERDECTLHMQLFKELAQYNRDWYSIAKREEVLRWEFITGEKYPRTSKG